MFEQRGYGDHTNGVCIAFVFVFEQSGMEHSKRGYLVFVFVFVFEQSGMGSIPRGVPTVE